MTQTIYVLQDEVTGRYYPERFEGYEEALAALHDYPLSTIRILDEVLRETGRR